LIENRHGLIADAMATQADGHAERDAEVLMLQAQWKRAPWRRRTVGGDKNRVSVRRGRPFADDRPTRGVIVGGGHHSLKVSVHVNRRPRRV
jgi:hypothetical protein